MDRHELAVRWENPAICRATSFNFFSVKIPLKAAGFEEKIHHEVEKVKARKRKRDFVPEHIRLI
jgi:hypothetical protein